MIRSLGITLIVATGLAWVAFGCSSTRENSIQIRFTDSALRSRAAYATYAVRNGGCDGQEQFSGGVSLTSITTQASMPVRLPSGRYAITISVRDAGCVEFAQGCTLVDLPLGSNAPIVVQAIAVDARAVCAAQSCAAGECLSEPRRDSGVDAATLDASSDTTIALDASDSSVAPNDTGNPSCTPGARVCSRDILYDCDVRGQLQRVRACALGCNSAASDCARLQPAHALSSFEDQLRATTVSGWVVGGAWPRWSLDTDSATFRRVDTNGVVTTPTPADLGFIAASTSAGLYLGVDTFTVLPSTALEVVGSRPLILRVKSNASVQGSIGVRSNCGSQLQQLLIDGSAGSPTDVNSMQGGGGGGSCTRGGRGGGTSLGSGGGAGGLTSGTMPWITDLTRGGNGGRGIGATAIVAAGGCGGGALQISANNILEITPSGIIDASGEGGAPGTSFQGGAGGGAGGTILLEAPEFRVSGGLVTVAGGGGGGGANSAPGVAGTRAPRGGMGGSGAPGVPSGGNGADGSADSNSGGTGADGSNTGGGGAGGGSGYLIFTMAVPNRSLLDRLEYHPTAVQCVPVVRAERVD